MRAFLRELGGAEALFRSEMDAELTDVKVKKETIGPTRESRCYLAMLQRRDALVLSVPPAEQVR
jgi:hypothetical protein